MFSSFSQDEDSIFPPPRKNQRVKNFPLDCIGEILSYSQSVDVFKKFICLSKDVQKYIKTENEKCCQNIKFRFIINPTKKVTYVRNLVVVKSLIFNGSSHLEMFPNIQYLCLDNVRFQWNFFKSVPKLRKLSIQNCQMMIGNEKVLLNSCYEKLEVLKMDFSHSGLKKNTFRKFSTESFLSFPSLRKLELCKITFTQFDAEHFKNLKNLRVLRLKRVRVADSSIFKYTPNLEVVDLESCHGFKTSLIIGDGFSNLSVENIDVLRIVGCSNIKDREEILKCFGGKEPRNFEFVGTKKDISIDQLTDDDREELMNILRENMMGRLSGMVGDDEEDDSEGWTDEEEEQWD